MVGTGDNFAPRLEARVFDPKAKYQPGNKELYYWYENQHRWVFYKNVKDFPDLKKQLREGNGTIPTDNVGCFLYAAGYAAVVPGQYDFYFGPERVRELARFMAGLPKRGDTEPPQMLGANLVIKTVRVEPLASSPQKVKSKWPDESSVQNLGGGKPIYPWFSSLVRIKVPAPERETVQGVLKQWFEKNKSINRVQVEEFLDGKVKESSGDEIEDWTKVRDAVKHLGFVHVCRANDFNEITVDACKHGQDVKEEGITGDKTGITYSISIEPDRALPLGRDRHYSTFEPGKNYGLCQPNQNSQAGKDEIEKSCLSFSVQIPFFYFPDPAPVSGKDPDPFVVLHKNGSSRPDDVAIFGVVDPDIGRQIGVLNFSWLNQDDKLKTIVSAEDPVEAINQQLEYFQRSYPEFTGLKILLAQMSPSVARVLAAHFPQFQVIVTAADAGEGTSETKQSTEWTGKKPAGAFVAVPSPYFDLAQKESLEGSLHFGLIEASNEGPSSKWNLTAPNKVEALEVQNRSQKESIEAFQALVNRSPSRCLPPKSDPLFDRVKWLTLCVMRERTGADVALIQKRDLYDEFRAIGQYDPMDPTWVQQILDRIIWKGDLLTLLYVPGSSLKKALDQSKKKYDVDDKNPLSLADEKSRGLQYLGVSLDKEKKQYLVNEMPLDEKKIYSVATTDYIAGGDTDYPDLAAALNQKVRPTQFPEQLQTISGIVCGELRPNNGFTYCLDELTRDTYLDASNAEPTTSSSQPSFGSRLWKLFPFKMPSKDSPPKPTSALEQEAQHHPIWSLALRNFSLGFTSLSNNLTDAQLGAKFAAVSTSGVTAKKTHTVTVGLDTKLSRSSHLNEFFVAMGIDYNEQSTGDVTPSLSRLKNRVTGDASFVRNIRGGRSKDRVGIIFALHAETPLKQPFATTFTLGTKDTLKITQNRSVLLLPRIGMRWQNGDNFFEVGGQVGREIQAFSGYRFNTQGSIVECLPSATQTFAACITEKSTAPMTAITKDSVATAILRNRPRAGLYWKYGLSIPFGSKVKYDINQEGNQEADFFFNFDQDNSADTRFLDRSKHSLKFIIWPSFSIGPSLQFLLYRNKVNHDFLFQKQFGFEANFSFNLSNHREKEVQIKYKP
ncbi:MAG TPA: 5'-nucleotidase C-terminal domain-containing protein [Pyrinomonadaceae bacterium]|nr:5'-nucleotidase C-terminal domain-containing protein [Pyrinomonadaceae bacterium]